MKRHAFSLPRVSRSLWCSDTFGHTRHEYSSDDTEQPDLVCVWLEHVVLILFLLPRSSQTLAGVLSYARLAIDKSRDGPCRAGHIWAGLTTECLGMAQRFDKVAELCLCGLLDGVMSLVAVALESQSSTMNGKSGLIQTVFDSNLEAKA